MKKPISIYIHWPFCLAKCPYCDFNSHIRDKINQEAFNKAYIKEIDYYRETLANSEINSIFFGGGTPSLMDASLVGNIIAYLSKLSSFADNIEISLEANPTSIESNKFKSFKASGINRVSVGIQSLNEQDLNFLGRKHSKQEALNAIELASSIFNNYSFDLIYALPNQDLSAWEAELETALKLCKYHISLYQLTIEKGTQFFNDFRAKKFDLPNDLKAVEMYNLTREITAAHGFNDYEISNYAKEGFQCRHNLAYWNYEDYIGIGPGAHGRYNNKATMTFHSPEKWLSFVAQNGHGIQNLKELSNEERIQEFTIMNIRKNQGINKSDFAHKLNKQFSEVFSPLKIQQLELEGLVVNTDDNFTLTNKGKLVLNQIVNFLL
jgi:putative oxygen-independent coproporphyrinogen III oxidase